MSKDENTERKNDTRAETEQKLHRFTILVYESAVQLMDVFAMPTAANVELLFKLSLGLFVITGLCQLIGFYTFLSWYGTGFNLIMVTVLMLKEKGDQNLLTKSYKIAAERLKVEMKRGKKTVTKAKKKMKTKKKGRAK